MFSKQQHTALARRSSSSVAAASDRIHNNNNEKHHSSTTTSNSTSSSIGTNSIGSKAAPQDLECYNIHINNSSYNSDSKHDKCHYQSSNNGSKWRIRKCVNNGSLLLCLVFVVYYCIMILLSSSKYYNYHRLEAASSIIIDNTSSSSSRVSYKLLGRGDNSNNNRYKPRHVYLNNNHKHQFNSHQRERIIDISDNIPIEDNSQLYGVLDSSDPANKEVFHTMEMKEPYIDGDCVPMQDWQVSFYPSCNSVHELPLASKQDDSESWMSVLGTKGYFRMAWKVDLKAKDEHIVLKTLKIGHTFEDAFYEKNRVDAVAMERLTGSPHVINIFGLCGMTVLTELADGRSLGKLTSDSSNLERLVIAHDVAEGLADTHEIDGPNNTTLVHFDINPGNVISIDGTLKLNDFNISILRKWNKTINKPCGIAARYPNPQWRSPEEALNRKDLTEKIDVYSMGNIFFRLIAGGSPWGRFDSNPTKQEIDFAIKQGQLPQIPSKVLTSKDPTVVAIREAMIRCFTFDPDKRPSARVIANSLKKAITNIRETMEDSEKDYSNKQLKRGKSRAKI